MSGQLFIELSLDEDVDVLVAKLLRARGFVAVTTQEAGLLGSTDDEQPAHPISERKALLTHNRRDFERLATASSTATQKHHGIIIAARHDVHELVRRLLLVLNHTTADEMENQVRYI
jgi:Domain of unknown function (DUF5615)